MSRSESENYNVSTFHPFLVDLKFSLSVTLRQNRMAARLTTQNARTWHDYLLLVTLSVLNTIMAPVSFLQLGDVRGADFADSLYALNNQKIDRELNV